MYQKHLVENNVVLYQMDTGKWIPADPANRHYREYLEWVAEGNTALVVEDA